VSAVALPIAAARTVRPATVYAAATAVLAGHMLVAAATEGGVLETLLPLGVALGLAAAFPRLRPGVAAWVSFVVGMLALVDGVLHVVHGATSVDDVTGIAAGAAGIALLAVAVRTAMRPK
jgi:hypothetical protein